MLKAIAQADKERAINVEESNDTSGYRTLSCVLREETIPDTFMNNTIISWREMANADGMLSHCASDLIFVNVLLLMRITFRRSAPMLTWKLELPE